MAESSVREVIYRIKIEPDPKGAAQTKRFADDIKKSFDTATRATSEMTKLQKAEQDEAIRSLGRAYSGLYRGMVKEAKEAEKAQERLRQQFDKASRELKSANNQVAESFEMTASGAMKLGRAVTLFGLAGEQETKKVIDALVKFQAVADTVTGTVQLLRGVEKAWAGIRAATLAATTAQAAYNAMAAAGPAGGAAKGAVGGAAAGAAGGAAGSLLAGGTAATLGAGAAAIIGGGLGTRAIYEFATGKDQMPGSQGAAVGGFYASAAEGLGLANFGTAGRRKRFSETENRLLGNMAFDEQRSSQLSAEQRMRDAKLGADIQIARGMSKTDLEGNRAALGLASGEAASAKAALATTAPGVEQDAANARVHTALERQRDLLVEQKRLVEEKGRNAIQDAEKELDKLRQQRDERKRMVDDLKKETEGAAERFAQLQKPEQQRLLGLVDKANKGGSLSREEIQQLGQFRDIGNIGQSIQRGSRELGGEEFKKFLDITGQAEAQRKAEAALVKLEADINVKSEIKLKLEEDSANQAKAIAEQLAPKLREMAQLEVAALERELDRQSQRQQAQNIQRSRAGAN